MKKWLAGLVGILVMLISLLAIFVGGLDASNYRDQIVAALSQQINRTISPSGSIGFVLSWHGAEIRVRDVIIGNPSWASRPTMANIGTFDLDVSLLPLLSHRIVITRLDISDADIALETDKNGHRNWDLRAAGKNVQDQKNTLPASTSVSVYIDRITISNSQIIIRSPGSGENVLDVKYLSAGGLNSALRFEGAYNDIPLRANINTGADDLLSPHGVWPFHADITYAAYKLAAQGSVDLDAMQARIGLLDVDTRHSDMHGKFVMDWSGTVPSLHGALSAGHVDPDDFKIPGVRSALNNAPETAAPEEGKYMFSNAPLDLRALKLANAELDIKIGDLAFPGASLKDIETSVNLNNGVLSLAPFRARLDESTLNGQIRIDTAVSPPEAAISLSVPNVKLEDLLSFLGAPAFLSGIANLNINLAGSGESLHDMASSAVGILNLTSSNGQVSSHAAASIAAELLDLFAPHGSNALNCLAVRFIVKNGVAHDNGILVDTGATTVTGSGGFDLGHETLDLVMHAKAKDIDVGNIVPPLRVSGTFLDPNFSIDSSETVKNVAGLFSGGSLDSGIPDVVDGQAENSCIYALDHPSSATTSKTILPSGFMGRVRSGLDNIVNVLRGLLGN